MQYVVSYGTFLPSFQGSNQCFFFFFSISLIMYESTLENHHIMLEGVVLDG